MGLAEPEGPPGRTCGFGKWVLDGGFYQAKENVALMACNHLFTEHNDHVTYRGFLMHSHRVLHMIVCDNA
jgi:hypothetical protein